MTTIRPLRYFREHLDVYQRQAAEEQWRSDHQTAMQCCELEEFIELGLSLFNLIRGRAYAVQDAIARGDLEYSPEISHAFVEAYGEWLKPCATVERAIKLFESKNYIVAKAEEFRAAVRDLSLHEFDINSIIKAVDDLREGRGKPLAEAIRELQRECSARCV